MVAVPACLDQSESFPLLMRCIHQAEDLCESASHAAYYLLKHPQEYEFLGVEAATSQAGYHLRRCGKMLEDGYNESNWFDIPNELSKAPRSKLLLRFLLSDLTNAVRKINKAISYLADYKSCKVEVRELRKARACLTGSVLALRQCFQSLLCEIRCEEKQAGKGKAKT